MASRWVFVACLPEDAVFDADGDQIAVVVYQDHDAPRSEGWVRFFNVDARLESSRSSSLQIGLSRYRADARPLRFGLSLILRKVSHDYAR